MFVQKYYFVFIIIFLVIPHSLISGKKTFEITQETATYLLTHYFLQALLIPGKNAHQIARNMESEYTVNPNKKYKPTKGLIQQFLITQEIDKLKEYKSKLACSIAAEKFLYLQPLGRKLKLFYLFFTCFALSKQTFSAEWSSLFYVFFVSLFAALEHKETPSSSVMQRIKNKQCVNEIIASLLESEQIPLTELSIKPTGKEKKYFENLYKKVIN